MACTCCCLHLAAGCWRANPIGFSLETFRRTPGTGEDCGGLALGTLSVIGSLSVIDQCEFRSQVEEQSRLHEAKHKIH